MLQLVALWPAEGLVIVLEGDPAGGARGAGPVKAADYALAVIIRALTLLFYRFLAPSSVSLPERFKLPLTNYAVLMLDASASAHHWVRCMLGRGRREVVL